VVRSSHSTPFHVQSRLGKCWPLLCDKDLGVGLSPNGERGESSLNRTLRGMAGASAIVLFAGAPVPATARAERGLRVSRTVQALDTEIAHEQQAEATPQNVNRVEGVVQTADGEGVAGVSITLQFAESGGQKQALERRATGGQEGKFSFTDLPAGKYTLRAEAPGFQPVTREVLLSEGAPTASLQITLEILPVNETVVVSETRTAQQLGDLPTQATVLSAKEISRAATLTLDDFLRQVPSFSLFRRGSSLVAHPTTQGVSLRGIGASGVSRTLVLLDGVPFNDPVGSWVYWSKIPLLEVERVEVDEGGISALYGSSAMAGVIDVTTRRPSSALLDVQGLWGTRGTGDLDLLAGDRRGPITYSLGGDLFRTDGFNLTSEAFRGPVDVKAASQHETGNGRVDAQVSKSTLVFLSGRFFNEVRNNGTPLQNNGTREGFLQAGLRSHTKDGSDWQGNFYSFDQRFRSSFSSIAPNRQTETLTLLQGEPSYGYGGNGQWSRPLPGSQVLMLGGDGRWIYARDHENAFAGPITRDRRIAGEQAYGGGFFQDFWSPWWRLNVIAGTRVDYWRNYAASRTETVLPANTTTVTVFPDVSKATVTSRAGLVFHLTKSISLRGAFYQGFRAPTLDELYRSFRVGNVVTNANANLGPEHVNGYEFGVNQQVTTRIFWRATLFADRLDNPVSNVTISTTPVLITQQRENLGYVNVKGAEADLSYRLERRWGLDARYLFNQSVVGSFAADPTLVGNLLPQVPKHRTSARILYSHAKWADASVEGRYESYRFDDSRNQRKLGSYLVLNFEVSRALGERWRGFLNLENALNREYFVQTTPVPQIGTPILFSGGVRYHWGKAR
jgi:iron complex outermembrane receptor protein